MKVLFWLVAGLLLLVILLFLLIQLPSVQHFARGKVENYLNEKLETRVEIGRFRWHFPDRVLLEDLYLEDRQADTLLSSGAFLADVNLFRLLRNEVEIREIRVEHFVSHIRRSLPDSSFNFDFIIEAFATQDTTPTSDTSEAPMFFELHKVVLEDIRLSYEDETMGSEARVSLDGFSAELDETDLENMRFGIEKSLTSGLALAYQDPAMEAGLGLGELDLQRLDVDLNAQAVEAGSIRLENTGGHFRLAKVSPSAETAEEAITAGDADSAAWRLKLGSLLVNNTDFRFDDDNAPLQPEGIDYMHLDLQDLSLDLRGLEYSAEQISGELRQASLREKSGLALQDLRSKFLYSETRTSLEEFYLETGESLLRDRIVLEYPSLEALSEDPGSIRIDARLQDSRIAYADILRLAPFVSAYPPFQSVRSGTIEIQGLVQGLLSDLEISELEVRTLDQTRLSASARLQGLPEMESARFDIDLRELSSGRSDLLLLAGPDLIPSSMELPASLSLQGSFLGSMDDFRTEALLRSSFGSMRAAGVMQPGGGEGRERYEAQVEMNAFDMGRFLGQADLGRISLKAAVKGQGTRQETARANINASLSSAEYGGYQYRNLQMEGSMANQAIQASAGMEDPNLDFQLHAAADLSGTYPAVNLDLRLDSLDLQALNLYEGEFRVKGALQADLPTADPDYLNGSVYLQGLQLQLDSGSYALDTICLSASANDTLKHIDIVSDFMSAALHGNFRLTTLGNSLIAAIDRRFDIDPTDSLVEADTSVQQFSLTAWVAHPPVLRGLVPDLQQLDTIQLEGYFSNQSEELEFNAFAPGVVYGSNELDSLRLAIEAKDSVLQYQAGLMSFRNPALEVRNTSVEGELEGNEASLLLSVRDPEEKERYRIGGLLRSEAEAYLFSFFPEGLMLDYEEWEVAENNLFHYSDSGYYARDMQFSREGQLLRLHSSEPRPGADLQLHLESFELGTLTKLVQQDSLAAEGQLNGDVVLSMADTTMSFTSDLQIRSFRFNRDSIGDIFVNVNNLQQGSYEADVRIESPKNQVRLAGSYYPEMVNDQNFDMALDILRLDMGTVEAFSFGQLQDASGHLKGSFQIGGNMDKPRVTGALAFQEVAFRPAYLNSLLMLEDEVINMTEEGLVFKQFTLLDSARNEAVLDGRILTSDFSDYRFDLRLKTENFQLVNSKPEDNELYYGQLFLDSDIAVKGTMDKPDVQAYLRVNEKTDFSFVLPGDEPGVQEREGVVEFVDMDLPPDTADAAPPAPASGITGMNLSADVEVAEEATFTVVVDPVNGDALRVRGMAALSTGIDPSGTISLTGRYEIIEGSYELSFNLLRRRFEIRKGSSITWTGDPYSADVDITAVYVAETAPMELVQDQLVNMTQTERNRFKQRMPFLVELNMEGELMKPDISFNIDLPEKEQDAHEGIVYQRLQQLQVQESELNKQVFALLVLNRFVAENPLESAAGSSVSSLARQSVSKLLSEQLNRLAGDLIAGVDLQFDLESTEDYSTGEKVDRTDLNVGLSKSLLNDRIVVNVGSSFGLEGQETRGQASTIAGDVSVDYQLSRDGRYRLRAYRQNEYEGVIEGQIIETGLSFIISLDYDEFKELFRK